MSAADCSLCGWDVTHVRHLDTGVHNYCPGVAPRAWTQHGNESEPGVWLHIFPHPSLVRMCGISPDEINAVTLTEDPDGDYYGWIATDEDDPSIVHYTEGIFNMCFPYGVKAEVERGKGEVVRMTCEKSLDD